MSRIERLKEWANGLDTEKLKEIVVECVDNLIDFEYVCFYESNKSPYWDTTGERLDGTEEDEED